MNFGYKENAGKKSFSCKSKATMSCVQLGEHDCSANNKKKDIVMSIQVCIISWMNFDCKEMVERKAFLTNPKHQYRVS